MKGCRLVDGRYARGKQSRGVIHFQFGERGCFDMNVLELQPAARVLWQVVDGPEEWIGTKVMPRSCNRA